MRDYAETYKDVWIYNLLYNFLIQLLPLQRSVFMVHVWNGNKEFPKGSSQNEIVPLFLLSFTCYTVNIWVWKYVFIRVVIKVKVFYLCHTRVIRVALMSHSCSTRVSCVSIVLHSCHSYHTRVAFVSLVPGTCVVNQTRS